MSRIFWTNFMTFLHLTLEKKYIIFLMTKVMENFWGKQGKTTGESLSATILKLSLKNLENFIKTCPISGILSASHQKFSKFDKVVKSHSDHFIQKKSPKM